MPDPKKKRVCQICETEHNVGEACPDCGWHQEEEEKKARADRIRKSLREKEEKEPRKKGLLF